MVSGLLLFTVLFCTMTTPSALGDATTAPHELDGASIWSNATILEQLGASYPAYRCAGSAGANASADWILSKFQEIGLEAYKEGFQFHGWDLASRPFMEVAYQNGSSQSNSTLASFQSEHFSVGTTSEGAIGELVLLPLPSARSYGAFTDLSFNPASWQGIDVHDRIVLVGREVRWNSEYEEGLADKIQEGPAALVFYYSQPWSLPFEVMTSASSGGRPLSGLGSYLYAHDVPTGHLDTNDSEWLLSALEEGNISARVLIDAWQGIWTQHNIVASLPGESGQSEQVLLTAHYDSVMDGGFCDNAVSVAALIEVASVLKSMRDKGTFDPSCTISFIAFTGEELGLVGSEYYYAMHAIEMDQVKAVVNVDCIGAGAMTRTITEPSQGLDLDELVDEVALELGISLTIVEGGSDHSSFIFPHDVAWQMQTRWGLSPQIPGAATPVISSISLLSEPMTLLESLPSGNPGWIHTSRDSSSYCSSSGWVTEGRLQEQGSVVLAVVLELAGTVQVPDDGGNPFPATAIAMAALAIVAVAVLLVLVLRPRAPRI